MNSAKDGVSVTRADKLKVHIYRSREEAGDAAAEAVKRAIIELEQRGGDISVVFATGASQMATLNALTSLEGLAWGRVTGFHLDEYVGISDKHPASFRRYLRERLTRRVGLREFFEIKGDAPSPAAVCHEYAERLRAASPQVGLIGIGENGHLAFNDPAVADFEDPFDVKVVDLDDMCKGQQVAEGWFDGLSAVPAQAITLTIPALFRIPKLIISVPGDRKAAIVRRTLQDPISTDCPATILRTHPDATLYLDTDSAAEL